MGMSLVGVEIAVAVAAAGYYLYRTWHLIPMKIERGINSDDFTVAAFINFVDEAAGTMLVCDDGNRMPGSVYESERVVAAVRGKLKRDREFRMRCLFSSDHETAFRRAFTDHDRVEFRTVTQRREVHCKIINGGRKGYLSVHRKGDRERQYTIYSRVYGRARREIFGPHMDDIEQVFAHAA